MFWHLLATARQNPAFSADMLAGLDLVMFLLLTGTRRNEGAMLTWDRVNLDDTDPASMSALPKHNTTTIITPEGEAVASTFGMWLGSDRRMVAYTLTFDPSAGEFCAAEDGRHALNLWKPRPHTAPQDWQRRIGIFLEHITFLIPDEAERNRFLDWLAHAEQQSGVLPHNHYLMIANSRTRHDEVALELVASHPRDLNMADDLFHAVFDMDPSFAPDAGRKWALLPHIARKAGIEPLPKPFTLLGRPEVKVWALRNA